MSSILPSEKTLKILAVKKELKETIEKEGIDMTGISFSGYAAKISQITGESSSDITLDGMTGDELEDLEMAFTEFGFAEEAQMILDYQMENELYPSRYQLAVDADFQNPSGTYMKYIGTKQYVIIPKVILGKTPTNLRSSLTEGMFEGNTNVKGVILASDTNVYSLQYAFYGYSNLTLELKYFNIRANSHTEHRGAFWNCKATTLDLRSLRTSGVRRMNQWFYKNEATRIRGFENFDTSNVTDMSSMFNESLLTSLDLSSFNTSKVTTFNTMFVYSKITVLDISSFTHEQNPSINNMFGRGRYPYDPIDTATIYVKNQTELDYFSSSFTQQTVHIKGD